MEVTYNHNSLRARSARWRKLFSGKRILVWRFLFIAAIVVAVVSWTIGFVSGVVAATVLALLLLQSLLWWRLYLRRLPVSSPQNSSLCIDCQAEADLLSRLKPGQSPKQLWKSLSRTWQFNFMIGRLLLDEETITHQLSDTSSDMDQVWHAAAQLPIAGNRTISVGAVLTALILSLDNAEEYLSHNKLTTEDVVSAANWLYRTDRLMNKLQQKRSFGGIARDWASGYTPLLNRFAKNMSADVEHGAYQHLYLQTHSDLLDQSLQYLSGSRGASVALIGETGSGKTSLAYALSERLLDPRNQVLRYNKVFALNASMIVSEAKRTGNLEALLLRIVAEAQKARNIILFFDDAHSFFSEESGASDMTNVLLDIIRSEKVRTLFAFRPEDWQSLVSRAGDISTSMQQIKLQEPDRATIEKVLQDQALGIEAESRVTISHLAIKEAYELADRYIPEQAFPGKAISLLSSAAKDPDQNWVLPATLHRNLETVLGVKLGSAAPEESRDLLKLEEDLHQYMINQDYAVKAVSDALRRARAGVRNQGRPVGSFLFLGPTGVGKTELCKALARVYYQGENAIIRADMSEYSADNSSQRLLASSAKSGSFLADVRSAPFSVVLLDEIEKASAEVMNLLLQMLDEGQLTDVDGRSISFKDAIIIATSNAGADIIRSRIDEGYDLEDFSDAFIDQLIESKQFRPELINRFDETVLFRPLNRRELRQVVQLLLNEVNANITKQQISIDLSETAIDKLVEQGYDPRLGARPMRRMMQRTVENIVSKRILSGELQPGSSVTLDVDDITAT